MITILRFCENKVTALYRDVNHIQVGLNIDSKDGPIKAYACLELYPRGYAAESGGECDFVKIIEKNMDRLESICRHN